MLAIIMTIGIALSRFFKTQFDLAIPSYVGAMFCAIIFNNLNIKFQWIDMDRNLITILGETALNVFLSMALISLKLWELAALAVNFIQTACEQEEDGEILGLICLYAQILKMSVFRHYISQLIDDKRQFLLFWNGKLQTVVLRDLAKESLQSIQQ